MRQPLFQLHGNSVITGVAYIVAEQRHGSEAWERTQQLLLSDGGPAQRRRGRNLQVVRIRNLSQQGRSHGKVLRRELVDIRVGYAEPRILRTKKRHLHVPVPSN